MKRYPALKGSLFVLAWIVAFQIGISGNTISGSPQNADADVSCTTCNWVLGEVSKATSKESTDQDILMWLDRACAILPQQLQGSCNTFVVTYKHQIPGPLKNGVPPNEICRNLGQCAP